jgi:hypothetical protein
MALLEEFLKAADLDDLLKIRGKIGAPDSQELDRIAELLGAWSDGQAVSNLLFYPALIPEALRISSIDRALGSTDHPYFILAAVVGLQGIDPASIPAETRARWVCAMRQMVRSKAGVISSRASVTVWSWLRDGEIEQFVRSYPVPDETASKNIITFTLSRFGERALPEYRARLRACGLRFWRRRDFLRRFQEYQHKKQAGGAVFMTMPLLSYIPNYGNMER